MNIDFQEVKKSIIGDRLSINGVPVIYADWTASGRLYQPIETFITDTLGPWVANTHTESSDTGQTMTHLYHQARATIKRHVNATENDVLICTGTGMTGAVNKLQRLMGLRSEIKPENSKRPLVLITHMEHHSNQTSWEECNADVMIVPRASDGLPDLDALRSVLAKHHDRALIGSFSACSNVTGIKTNYHQMAELMHEFGGLCFVDFAASAPYVDIDMHPENPMQKLDAVMFSPHKFLGGPGSCGILIFDQSLYQLKVPDQPGGGTVSWTNPWGGHRYFDDIETREDGGTPGFLQCIRAALAIQLKESMTTEAIAEREAGLTQQMFVGMNQIDGLHLLEPDIQDRLPIFSFWIENLHHNLVVRILNDRYGVQCRGGCSCAGTYGHILLGVSQETSENITCEIDHGDLTHKPGWIRISLHPTMTESDVDYILSSLQDVAEQGHKWAQDYQFDASTGEWESIEPRDIRAPVLTDFKP